MQGPVGQAIQHLDATTLRALKCSEHRNDFFSSEFFKKTDCREESAVVRAGVKAGRPVRNLFQFSGPGMGQGRGER